MAFSVLPYEVFNFCIFPHVPAVVLYALGSTSVGLHKYICECAKQSLPDINREGMPDRITLIKANQTMKGLLRQKWKLEFFNIKLLPIRDSLPSVLFDATNAVQARGENGLQQAALKGIQSQRSKWENWENWGDKLIPYVFSHPNAKFIPLRGRYGLEELVTSAISCSKPDVFLFLLTLPNAKNLSTAKLGNSLKLVEDEKTLGLLFSHPNSKDISPDVLGHALKDFILVEKQILAKMVLAHPNALNISETTMSVGNEWPTYEIALKMARMYNQPEIAQNIENILHAIKMLNEFAKVMPDEEACVFAELKKILETANHKELSKTFRLLSVNTRHLMFKVLCILHGQNTTDVDHDGIQHIARNPAVLLPIINSLLAY